MRRNSSSPFIQALIVALVALPFCGVAGAQAGETLIKRAEALKAVEVVSVPNWLEVVSPEGQFRILFPVEPKVDDNVISVKGWRVTAGDSQWVAYFSKVEAEVTSSERSVREGYDRAYAAVTKDGDSVLMHRDVLINGRLGRESVIARQGKIDYTRTFLTRGRVYLLSVHRTAGVANDATIPADVLQFFNSFACWDVD